jgi:hypothetical protein
MFQNRLHAYLPGEFYYILARLMTERGTKLGFLKQAGEGNFHSWQVIRRIKKSIRRIEDFMQHR